MNHSAAAEYIRAHQVVISRRWEEAVRGDLEALARMPRGVLVDHFPEILEALSQWIEGRSEDAEVTFASLTGGHAIQRLGFGVELVVVCIEYAWLRQVLLEELLAVDLPASELIRLNQGLDRAIQFAIRRYTEHRDQIRNRFIGILGHDLRTPLNSASMAATMLLQSETLEASDRKRALIITRATERMNRLVNAVLDFAHGHLGGGIPVKPEDCDMREVCSYAVAEAESAHPDRTIQLELEGDLRGAIDRDRALQALGNLLSNAIAHGQDPIVLRAEEGPNRQSVVTSVANGGARIPAPVLQSMFDPLAHLTAPKEGHLGLGLFIVSQIATAHGGTIEVDSTDERTVFTIRWPRATSRIGSGQQPN